ncbi:MAG: BtpA/SgcQ family protein [Bacteroidales bacterium]|nr:BtpA/SgcQ family protein [Bacteroidales bacterium]MCF8405908.1 BtpA/SgcQ family protein [Bacteroidales bacterium]
MKNNFDFFSAKPLIACVHLLALPGAPLYEGSLQKVIDFALNETTTLVNGGINNLIIENFRDIPFYPGLLPPETIASFSIVAHEIKKTFNGVIGINALRNDALTALSIAHAIDAAFIRVNVHTGAMLTDQGIIHGEAYKTLRQKHALCPEVKIFADVSVKHATPIGTPDIVRETKDTVERGMADAVIVSGKSTGARVNIEELTLVKKHSAKPVLVGSGTAVENLPDLFPFADGFIVGSYFKKDGLAENSIDSERLSHFMETYNTLIENEKKI